ncbi:MAG: ribokinase, partial [Planctomycetes bacterium]|nr:ribokinase [Planctomycetota bacterium]
MKPRVLVIGSINMDLVVRVDRMPREGETIIGREFQTFPGGKGANQAVACARLGAQTFMAGRLGTDPFGDALLENLRKDGIDTAHIARDPGAPSGTAMIIVDKSGQNSIVVSPGANMRMKPSDADALDELIRRVNCVVVQLETPLEVVSRALDLAQKAGVKSILDAGPAVKCPMSILKKADVVSPNEVEAQTLIG